MPYDRLVFYPFLLHPVTMSATNTSSTAQVTPQKNEFQDCLQCRVVGTATFAGLGIYSFMQARRATPGSLWEKRIAVALGAGAYSAEFFEGDHLWTLAAVFCAGAVVRWNNWGIPGTRSTEVNIVRPLF